MRGQLVGMGRPKGTKNPNSASICLTILICAAPFLVLEGLRIIAGTQADTASYIWRVAFSGSVLTLAWLGNLRKNDKNQWSLNPISAGILLAGLLAGAAYLINKATWAAWVFTGLVYTWTLLLSPWLLDLKSVLSRYISSCLLLAGVGITLATAGQIESRFSDEEFFVLLQALGLCCYGITLFFAYRRLARHRPKWLIEIPSIALPKRKPVYLGIGLLLAAAVWGVISSYQHSFYPLEAPGYTGIQAEQPFVCGDVASMVSEVNGSEVSQRILERVMANPNKGLPEYGMLALRTGDMTWLDAFKESILAEARQAEFTARDGSVKYGQHEAALRVYYYALVQERYPQLFSQDEAAELRSWFTAINQRVQTIGLVDWLYALAYKKLPSGPYENQDHGAGLLVLLEETGLAAVDLSEKNRAYLNEQERGWQSAFRVTDDVYTYQIEWILNAWFLSGLEGMDDANARLSFEWLLWQAIPDGGWPGYNSPYGGNLTAAAYLGAVLLQDGRMLWLADRALNQLDAQNKALYALPGMETPLELEAESPDAGSCLLYGNSGLPNQRGPLAPDKIVLRDGWDEDSSILSVNLRFTGWHRYKATNSIILYYQNSPLIQEHNPEQPFTWLPEGRSLFRDKRIPRENLNGLTVARVGFEQVLSVLTGFGGRWAQDPPYYATVQQFTTGEVMDQAMILMDEWHGWDSWRQVTMYHSGPVVILDQARGPERSESVLTWHVNTNQEIQMGRVLLGAEDEAIEMVFVPYGRWSEDDMPWQQIDRDQTITSIWVESRSGEICLATILLGGDWIGAETQVVQLPAGPGLEIRTAEEVIVHPLMFTCTQGDE